MAPPCILILLAIPGVSSSIRSTSFTSITALLPGNENFLYKVAPLLPILGIALKLTPVSNVVIGSRRRNEVICFAIAGVERCSRNGLYVIPEILLELPATTHAMGETPGTTLQP